MVPSALCEVHSPRGGAESGELPEIDVDSVMLASNSTEHYKRVDIGAT
jgi:hypothetical protein